MPSTQLACKEQLEQPEKRSISVTESYSAAFAAQKVWSGCGLGVALWLGVSGCGFLTPCRRRLSCGGRRRGKDRL